MNCVLGAVTVTLPDDVAIVFPPVVGVPVPAAGVPEAPIDGIAYARRNAAWEAAAGASGYVHAQASASATWTINHGLGYRPSVELLSAGGAEMIGEVVHPSTIQTLVYFVTPRTGSARLT